MSDAELFVLLLGTGLAAALKSGTGVGTGLFLLPTLGIAFDPFSALALSVPLLLIMDVLAVGCHWRRWLDPPAIIWMAALAMLGILCGVVAIPHLPGDVLKVLIGGVGVCYAACNLLRPFRAKPRGRQAPLYGRPSISTYLAIFLGGILNTINAGSILYSHALMQLKLDNRIFVATICILNFTGNFTRGIGFYHSGILTQDMMLLSIKFTPIIVLCSLIGGKYIPRLSPKIFCNIIYVLIFMVSCNMLLSHS